VEAICEEFYLQGDREAAMGMMVRRCTLKQVDPRVESAWFQLSKLNCADMLSRFAFNVNLRRYMMVSPMCDRRGRGGIENNHSTGERETLPRV